MYHNCIDDLQTMNIPKTELLVSNVERKTALSILNDNGVKDRFIVMVPGAAWPQKQWKLNNFVPLKSSELPKIIANPILYDLVLLKGIVTGKYFSIKGRVPGTELRGCSDVY